MLWGLDLLCAGGPARALSAACAVADKSSQEGEEGSPHLHPGWLIWGEKGGEREALCYYIYASATRGHLPKNVTCLFSAMSALISWEAPRGADVLQRTRKKELMLAPTLKSPLRVRYSPPLLSGTGERRQLLNHKELKKLVTDSRSGWYWYRTRFWSESEAARDVSS